MLEKFFDKILEEEEIEEEESAKVGKATGKKRLTWGQALPPLLLFFLALGVRLAFLFFNDPQSPGLDWYGDIYHHWQVAYLSKVVGFKHGFLRLWDLKGMEFFWGLAHPLVLIILFSLVGSVDILIPRLLSVFCGSLAVVFIYLLIKRHFSRGTAIVCGLWAALFSVALFSDTLGMQEQLGLVFLLGGIVAWPSLGFLSGFLWALASMVRAEYWLFAVGLVLAAFFDPGKKTGEKKALMFFGYFIPIVLYMKYMMEYTGNPIFPIWWNYLASVVGEWFTNLAEPLTEVQIQAQKVGWVLFALGFFGTVLSFLKRPKYYLFLLLGFFNVTFIGFILSFAAYLHGFFDRFWVDRLFAFPYLFLGIVIILFFLSWLPTRFPRAKKPLLVLGFLVFLIILMVSQLAWGKIMHYFRIAQAPYEVELKRASFIAEHDPGGKILFPAGRPALTYALVRNHEVSGERLISEMYDPYFYAQEGETPAELEEKMIVWLTDEEIKLVVYTGKSEYRDLFEKHPEIFKVLGSSEEITLYELLR